MSEANINSLTWGGDKSQPLPDASYYAKFVGLEEAPPHPEYGAGLRWVFEVSSGPHTGRKVAPITGREPTPKNICGRVMLGVLGRTPAEGETVNLAQYVGRVYILSVAGGKVKNVSVPPQQ